MEYRAPSVQSRGPIFSGAPMTESAVVYTSENDSAAAARQLCQKTKAALPGAPPDAMIVFASPRYDPAVLLRDLHETCRPGVLVGASSAGEFTSELRGEGLPAPPRLPSPGHAIGVCGG